VSELVEKLADAVAARDYGAVDDLWLELLEAETLPVDELAPLLERSPRRAKGRGRWTSCSPWCRS